jgi:hypothetical protein
MRFFNMFAVALSVLFLGSAQAAPFISSGEMPNPLIEPVRWHGYGYYGGGAHCYAPYVAVGDRCVYGGYRARYYGNGYRGRYYGNSGGFSDYDGAHCYSPYVSVGDRCVYGGYYGNSGGYYGNSGGYSDYDGAHCYFPYVSVGDRCVRAW